MNKGLDNGVVISEMDEQVAGLASRNLLILGAALFTILSWKTLDTTKCASNKEQKMSSERVFLDRQD